MKKRRRIRLMKRWIEIDVDGKVDEQDIEDHLLLLKGMRVAEVCDGDERRVPLHEALVSVGKKLWQVRDRENPDVLDGIIGEISEVCECDFSSLPVTGQYAVLTPKKDMVGDGSWTIGNPNIGVWTSIGSDVQELSGAFEKMKGVEAVEVS
jgi:hypothetical protein